MDAQTRMLMYYLNAMGQGLAGPKHPMQRVGAVTEQQIKAESQMKLIQKLLDSGGTVKRGKAGGIDVSGDVSYFISDIANEESIDKKNPFSGTMSELSKDEQTSFKGGVTGRVESQRSLMEQKFLNPSSSLPDISGADLIGLTPENISQALQFKFMSEELEHKKLSDIMEMLAPTPGAPIELPGVGKLSLRQWQALPSKERSYAYYVFTEEQRGDKPLEYDEWASRIDEPTAKQLYDIGKRDPEFAEWLTKYKEAGAIKIDIAGREVEKGLGKGKADVMSPGYAQSVKEDLMKDRTNWPSDKLIKQYTDKGLSYTEAEDRAQRRMILEAMDKQIRQAFKGKKVTLGDDGWYVDGVLKVGFP